MSASPVMPVAPVTPARTTTTRIENPQILTVVRILWILLVAFELTLLVVLVPFNLTSSAYSAQIVTQIEGLNIGQSYYTIAVIQGLITSLVSFFLAIVLMWRAGNERAAIFFSFIFLLTISASFGTNDPLLSRLRVLAVNFQLFAIFFLFPDGRFKPHWMGFIFVAVILWTAASLINYEFLNDSSAPGQFAGFFFGLGSIIYRYRKADTLQRQQLKWLVIALIMLVFVFISWPLIVFSITDSRTQALVIALLNIILNIPASLAIPIATGIAILRYRLYEVDLFLNRSLVYLGVTGLLSFIFVFIVAVVSILTSGQGQSIGVIVAAGLAGIMFNPTRKEVQRVIDRRIYRLRYDLNEVAAAQKKPDIKNPGAFTGKFFGAYEALGVLGRGGMGEVYKGFGNNETVAIKLLLPDLAQQSDFRQRFEREAQTLARLNHPNIVQLKDSGISDEVHFLAMEYIEGEDLSTVIKRGAVTDYVALKDWLRDIASALDYLHAQNMVHRDLKASNIMLRNPSPNSGRGDAELLQAVVMDFGIARTDVSGTRLTGTGAVGTIDYMAPEQIMAARDVDHRADIYAFGVIIYELLTGERPFKGGAGQVLFAHLQQPAPDPRDINPDIPREMAKAVLKALEKSPDERFTSAGEFVAALKATRIMDDSAA